MMEEIWKDIEGYEGLYQVSNMGNIKSMKRQSCDGRYSYEEFIKKPSYNNYGYKIISLMKDRKSKLFLVHRLVAKAFIPNPNKLPYINHKDECRDNNIASNLEWCTALYYSNYGSRNKKLSDLKSGIYNRKDQSKPVLQYDKCGNFIARYASTCEAKRKTGLNQSNISACCRGVSNHKTVGGFIFKFE